MKNNSFKITNKPLVWLSIPAVIILAGLILFFVLGFNPAASMADNKTLVIEHDPYINIAESLQEELVEFCEAEVEESGLSVISCRAVETSTGGKIEFTFSAETSNDSLYTLKSNILSALEQSESLSVGVYSGTVHSNISQYTYDYIWRTAICAGVAWAIAFVYVSIRYRLFMGFATLVAGVIDTAVTLALTVILQIPVTTALATAAIFATLYSILISTVYCNKLRNFLKDEQYANLPVGEMTEEAGAQTRIRILGLSIASAVVFAIIAIAGGSAVYAFAIPAIFAILASTFSGILLTPALATAFKEQGVKMHEKSVEKARLARQQAEAEKAKKKSANND